MAETKKTAIVKPVAKVADTKTAEVKTTPVAPAAKTAPVAEAEAPAKKETAKKTTTRKTAAKKATAKKETAAKKTEEPKKTRAGRKPAVKETLHLQFAGKAYTTEDLVKIAKDVWQYDLKMDEKDFKSVELYVKPEEHTVYYVINGDISGSFGI
ncbi:MAG: DUF6465 family protein [Clostridiales bacterium]|nr:DUF6465 family protein [Clostridiales bacterium]